MSTILDALRKARTEPPQGRVEARDEILRTQTHDYLATVPENPHDEVRVLRRLVYLSGALILLLVFVLVALLLKQQFKGQLPAAESHEKVHPVLAATQEKPGAATTSPAATAQSQPAPQEKTAAASEKTQVPEEKPITIVVATPMVRPQETPIPPLIETAVTKLAVENDDDILAKAAALRAEKSRPSRRRENISEENSGTSFEDIRIGGIMWDKKSPAAMVNGKIVRVGSTVRGAQIVKINPDSIVLQFGGKQYTVKQ